MKYNRYDNHRFESGMNIWFGTTSVCIECVYGYSIWIDFTKTSKNKHVGAALTLLMDGV